MEIRVESASAKGFLWPAPNDPVLWSSVLPLAQAARCRTINVRDFRIATGPVAWLYLNAALPELRTINLINSGVASIAHSERKEVVTKIPGEGKDVIMQRFAFAEHIQSPTPTGVVVTLKRVCACRKYDSRLDLCHSLMADLGALCSLQ